MFYATSKVFIVMQHGRQPQLTPSLKCPKNWRTLETCSPKGVPPLGVSVPVVRQPSQRRRPVWRCARCSAMHAICSSIMHALILFAPQSTILGCVAAIANRRCLDPPDAKVCASTDKNNFPRDRSTCAAFTPAYRLAAPTPCARLSSVCGGMHPPIVLHLSGI